MRGAAAASGRLPWLRSVVAAAILSILAVLLLQAVYAFALIALRSHTDMAAIRRVASATTRKVTAAGGITTQAEVDELDALGIDAVVGMAIYTRTLSLPPPSKPA